MKAGIGISDHSSSWEAGLQAAARAVATSGPPTLTILLTTDNYDQEAVLASARTVLGNSKLVGACSAGLFCSERILNQGVGILPLAGEELQAATALIPYPKNDYRRAGIELGEKLLTNGSQKICSVHYDSPD